MNGTSRLYRSTSDGILGGVASGLANYFKIDPMIVRGIFLLLMFFSGGTFFVVYLAMWALIPTAGSTATQPNAVIQENMDEMGNKVRSLVGGFTGNTGTTSGPTATNGTPNAAPGQLPAGSATQPRQGLNPMWFIWIGLFFLAANLGIFRAIHWSIWWPILLIGLGALMITRRNRA